jgi:transcriptional regulator with XRE-family HTH domain
MPRSVRLRSEEIGKVQTLVHHHFFCQHDLADELGFAQSTISNFINGKPVDRRKFQDICEKLGIEDWRAVAETPQMEPGARSVPVHDISTSAVIDRPSVVPTIAPTPPPPMAVDRLPLETPEGSVPLNSSFYIERLPQETYCKIEIAKPHALIRLKAPRQMGKTSMMMRLLRQAESQGDRTVYLSLEQVMEQAWSHADRFLHWFCASVSLKTQHKFQQEDYASLAGMVGSTLGTQEYFESYLLPDLAAPLTIGLDSIDRLFDYPHLYNNFFSLLRSLHEAGKHTEVLSKLRLVISHAAEVYIPLDINQSPFNVGISVEVSEFTPDRVAILATKHHLNWTQIEIDNLMSIIGGHPFLIRLAMFEVATHNIDLQTLLRTATSQEGIFYRRHLARIETTLHSQPDLLAAMTSVISSPAGAMLSPSLKGRLEGLGLVKFQGEFVVPRCELYRQYFRNLT